MTDRTLRIGYTCHDAFPSTHTNTQQIFWTLSEVARLGHRVDLCVPAAPADAKGRDRVARHYGAPSMPDTFRLRPLGGADATTPLAKASFDLRAPRQFTRGEYDVLWTRDPIALVAAVRTGIPVVFETYRPDFALAPAFVPWRLTALRSRHLHGVITHSRLAADAFVRAGVERERVLVAHNGHAPALMEPELSLAEARMRAALPTDRPLIVYTGHVGPRKGTDALIGLAAALPDVRLVIVGVENGSPEEAWVRQHVAAAGVSNVLLLPRVDLREVAVFLYAADVLVIPPTEEPLRRYGRTVLPMKLFSYLAAGRPILAPALPDVQEVLTDEVDAVLVPPGDANAAATAVRRLIDYPVRAARLASAARAASHGYTWSARAQKITAWLQATLRLESAATLV